MSQFLYCHPRVISLRINIWSTRIYFLSHSQSFDLSTWHIIKWIYLSYIHIRFWFKQQLNKKLLPQGKKTNQLHDDNIRHQCHVCFSVISCPRVVVLRDELEKQVLSSSGFYKCCSGNVLSVIILRFELPFI